MSIRLAISGFGRIGRLCLRAALETQRRDVEVVALNIRGDLAGAAHLFKYDSIHGIFSGEVSHETNVLIINGVRIPVQQANAIEDLDWRQDKVDVVLDSTGKYKDKQDLQKHIAAGAKKVLLASPGKGLDLTVVYGVNDDQLTSEHKIISNGSCTTNCLAPIAKVIHAAIGIERGYMTTIHSYTSDQQLHDKTHDDWGRARAAGMSIIPTTTGAAKAVGEVLPALKGKLDGTSLRVPTPNVSAIDFTFNTARAVTAEEINQALIAASKGAMKGIIGVYDLPLVSTDFNHSPYSASFALHETTVIDGTFARILAWYDNEWGFSLRMLDIAAKLGSL